MAFAVPYSYFELEIDKRGGFVRAEQLDAILDAIRSRRPSDVFIASHGWNNDMSEARDLYGELFTNVQSQSVHVPAIAARTFLVVGVLWPSKKFADQDLIPGGAASADDAKADEILDGQLRSLAELLGDDADAEQLQRARALLPRLEHDPGAQVEFARIALRLLPDSLGDEGDPHIANADNNADSTDGTLLDLLSHPSLVPPPTSDHRDGAAIAGVDDAAGAGEGGAAGIGDFFGGIKAGAINLLNYVTYYQMKDRAGMVGRVGVHQALTRIRSLPGAPRVHLVGHSFGARVVTAALAGPDDAQAASATTVSLLQGAFSHFGFAKGYDNKKKKDGLFRPVITQELVSGPFLITHTRNDTAVGIAYAVASRVGRQIAAAVGDVSDPYGGLGSNGAQSTPEADFATLLAPQSPYPSMLGRRITNLKGDEFIANHGDVRGPAVAYAILTALATT